MGTRLFRNANGILAVERDGVLVYGPDKVYRAVDVTIENRLGEHWVALPLADWRSFDEATSLAVSGAARIEPILSGKAAVFATPSEQIEVSLRRILGAFILPKTARDLARDRLVAWKAGAALPGREEFLNVLTLLGL